MKQGSMTTRKWVLMALMAAIAYVIVCLVRIPIVAIDFLRYEPKDVIIVMAGFLFGPLETVIISVVVSLLEMITISDTGLIGCIMNIVSTCAFATVASAIYHKHRTLAGAVFGLLAGIFAATAAMILWNWWLTPLYQGWPRETVEQMLLPFFLPFNLLKTTLNTALTLLLYKPLVTSLRKLRLVAHRESKGSFHWSVFLVPLALFLLCIGVIILLRS